MPSPVGERQLGGIFFGDDLVARVIASQKLSRDNGETVFAPGHQDVSQGPLGSPFSGTLSGHFGPEGPERLLPEPPKRVGKEGVGNSSTDLVSVQDWQSLLNP